MKKNITMKNQSQCSNANLYVGELEEPTPLIHGFLYPVHNGLIFLIMWISFKVQKAVFKTLDRLGSRHINTIIKTNMVSNYISTLISRNVSKKIFLPCTQIACRLYTPYLIVLGIRTTYYPMKDLFGEGFCHFFNFIEGYGAFIGQFHSFFLTTFRYICLFHTDDMMKHEITPKVNFQLHTRGKSLLELWVTTFLSD